MKMSLRYSRVPGRHVSCTLEARGWRRHCRIWWVNGDQSRATGRHSLYRVGRASLDVVCPSKIRGRREDTIRFEFHKCASPHCVCSLMRLFASHPGASRRRLCPSMTSRLATERHVMRPPASLPRRSRPSARDLKAHLVSLADRIHCVAISVLPSASPFFQANDTKRGLLAAFRSRRIASIQF